MDYETLNDIRGHLYLQLQQEQTQMRKCYFSSLLFLYSIMTKHSAVPSLPAGKSVVLQRAIAAAIKAQLAVPWLPPNCRLPLHGETQVNSLKLQFGVGGWVGVGG